MLKRIIPILLVENKELIKTIQFSKPTYIGDLLNSIKIYNELEVDELCILDKSAKKNGIDFEMIQEFTNECFSPISYGGGISKLEDISKLLRIGIEKVVISSHATNLDFILSAIATFGSSTISVCIDYKTINGKQFVFVENGSKNTGLELKNFLKSLATNGVGEFIFQCIDKDGTYSGYDLNLIKNLMKPYQNPAVILGGCSGILDIKQAFQIGFSGAAAGSLFVYYTNLKGILINYPHENELIENKITR